MSTALLTREEQLMTVGQIDGGDMAHANQRTARLKQFLKDEHDALLRTLRVYVIRAGLADNEFTIRTIASELLSDLTVEALGHADRFDAARAPMAWALGIAANLIARRQADQAKRSRREPLVRDLLDDPQDRFSDDDLWDRLAAQSDQTLDQRLEDDQGVVDLLRRVSPEDRRVLRLAIIHEMDGDALARQLGISPGAARVRLHRAIKRLRDAVMNEVMQ